MAKIALLVGVSEYQEGLQPLPSTIEDVRAMERVLKAPSIGGFEEVKILLNPMAQALRIEIYNLFADRSAEDLVLFYFSGHGVKDQNRNLYLTTSETVKKPTGLIIPPSAVKASYLQEQITNSRSEYEVIILDCCYSGAIAKGLTAKDEGEVDIIAELGGKGRAVLTSSTSVQSSFQQEAGLSIYTQYLVEGIETGAADLDSDGKIAAYELHEYTTKKVQQSSSAMTPQFFPVAEGYKIYLARSPLDDPRLKYRKIVEEIIEENRGEIDQTVDRVYLNLSREKLGISKEVAENIENELLEPFRRRKEKIRRYKEIFAKVIEKEKDLAVSTKNRKKLQRFQEILELRNEDIDKIEQSIIKQVKDKYPAKIEAIEIKNQKQPIEESIEESKKELKKQIKEELPKTESGSKKSPSLSVFSFKTVAIDIKKSGWFGLISKLIFNDLYKEAKLFKENLGNGVTLDMVSIPGGSFLMGAPEQELDSYDRERPQHQVNVSSFFMGRYPITQAQWKVVAEWDKVERDLDPDPSYFKQNYEGITRWNRPVEQVNWDNAIEFCKRLSKRTKREYRLPSEAQWEYACRAGTTTPFHFGETISAQLANYPGTYIYGQGVKGKYREQTTPVGYFKVANNFGLYDMHGNVYEWCEDDRHDNYRNAPNDGTAWISGKSSMKVIRGGSWGDFPFFCRSAYRYDLNPGGRFNYIGFRVVRLAPRTS